MTKPKRPGIPDPMEEMIRTALRERGVAFTEDGGPGGEINRGLDFHLTGLGIHIEVKQFHSERIGGQMERVPNVIAAQGREAVAFLAEMIRHHPMFDPEPREEEAGPGM